MAGRTEVAAFAGKDQQIFMSAVRKFNTGEPMVEVANRGSGT